MMVFVNILQDNYIGINLSNGPCHITAVHLYGVVYSTALFLLETSCKFLFSNEASLEKRNERETLLHTIPNSCTYCVGDDDML